MGGIYSYLSQSYFTKKRYTDIAKTQAHRDKTMVTKVDFFINALLLSSVILLNKDS